jgi:GGDEF domain-containing protein
LQRVRSLMFVRGLFNGLAMVMLLFALTQSTLLRDAAQGVYSLWALTLMFAIAAGGGVLSFFFGPQPSQLSAQAVIIGAPIASGLWGWMLAHATRVRGHRPRHHRALLWLAALHALPVALLLLRDFDTLAQGVSWLVMALALVQHLELLLWSVRRRDPGARWLLVGRVLFLAPVLLSIFSIAGLITDVIELFFVGCALLIACMLCTLTALVLRARMRRNHQELLQELSTRDAETALMLPAVFEFQINKTLARVRRQGTRCVLLAASLTNADEVLAALGIDNRRSLWQALASELSGGLGRLDDACRLTPQHFAVLIDRVGSDEEAKAHAQRLLARLIAVTNSAHPSVKPRFHVSFVPLPHAGWAPHEALQRLLRTLERNANNTRLAIFDAREPSSKDSSPTPPAAA